jgi:hypothetical protein
VELPLRVELRRTTVRTQRPEAVIEFDHAGLLTFANLGPGHEHSDAAGCRRVV